LSGLGNSRCSERIADAALAGRLEIHPDDDGFHTIGLDGPAFPTRAFALAVAAQISASVGRA
jgi:hypothetical protein